MNKKILWAGAAILSLGTATLCLPGSARATKACDADDLAGTWGGTAIGHVQLSAFSATFQLNGNGTGALQIHHASVFSPITAGDDATCTFQIAQNGVGTATCNHLGGYVSEFSLVLTDRHREVQFWWFDDLSFELFAGTLKRQ
jgi:hypothetical protein